MRFGITAVVVAIALAIVGMAARQGAGQASGDGPTVVVLPSLPRLFNLLFLIAVVLGVAVMGFLLSQRNKGPRRVKRARPKVPWWAQAIALVVILGVAMILNEALAGLIDLDAVLDLRNNVSNAVGDAIQYESSPFMGGIMTAFLAVTLVGSIAWWYLMVRATMETAEGPATSETFVAAAARDLDTIDDPRAAILACYAHLQQMVTTSGVATRRSDTPLQLLERVLEARNVDPDSITTLTQLFERARFSPHEIDESMRDRARAALEDVRIQLDAP
ncbi:MAG: DUF4129 domain-containing protein [Actinomycetota bacterium]